MGYTRRQEMFCTEAELKEYSTVVLYSGEILRVLSEDHTRLLYMLVGDGKTSINELPHAVDIRSIQQMISKNDKRLINVESMFVDDHTVTIGPTNDMKINVPSNAVPYAEIKKVAGGFQSSNGKILPKKIRRIVSHKLAEKETLDLTLDLSEMSPHMTVEKLADGSFKFNGYTTFYGDGPRTCKFATVTLPKGGYGINYKVISGEGYPIITVNGSTINNYIDHITGCFSIPEDNLTLSFCIEQEGSEGVLTDFVISFEICEGSMNGPEFVPAQVPFATLEIPEEICNIDGYGLYDNYLDFEKKEVVIIRRVVNGALPPLPEPEHIDVSQHLLETDNLIEVVAGGSIGAVLDNGTESECKIEIEFVVEGV
jgi:hypothetical protein